MLDADADRERLRLECQAAAAEKREHVAGRMPRREDHTPSRDDLVRGSHHARHHLASEREIGDPRREPDLTATVHDGCAERLHDLWEAIRPDVGMRVDQDIGRRPVAHQHVEHRADGTALRRAGVELAVGEGAGTTLAEAVVVVRVDDSRACDPRDRVTTCADVCSALEHDRPKTALDQRERREQPGRTRPDDHDRRCTAHVTESQRGRCLGAKRLVDPDPDAEQPHGTSLPRIERPPEDHVVRDRACRDAESVRETVHTLGRVVANFGGKADLCFGDHIPASQASASHPPCGVLVRDQNKTSGVARGGDRRRSRREITSRRCGIRRYVFAFQRGAATQRDYLSHAELTGITRK